MLLVTPVITLRLLAEEDGEDGEDAVLVSEPTDNWDEAVVVTEAPVLLEPPTLLEFGIEDDVALTVLGAEAVVALENAVVPAENVVRLDRVAEAELEDVGVISVEVVEAGGTETDAVTLLT